MSDKIKVIYIAGWGRSGSTILGKLLGQIAGCFFGGEIRFVWDRGIIKNGVCGCGRLFRECEIWSDILADAFGHSNEIDLNYMVRTRESGLRSRQLAFRNKNSLEKMIWTNFEEYATATQRLYTSISSIAKSNIIVDSSKYPSHAFLLSAIPNIDLHVVHLVRDPRAASFSWWNRNKLDPGRNRRTHNPIRSTIIWDEWNYIIRKNWGRDFASYSLLRYEDFVGRPRQSILGILDDIGVREQNLSCFEGENVRLGVQHAMAGNRNRFDHGVVRLEEDNEWQHLMPYWQEAVVTCVALPWLRQYGYPIFPRAQARSR